MNAHIRRLRIVARHLLLTACIAIPASAAPPNNTLAPTREPEHEDQPYLPPAPQTPRFQPRAPVGSVQVNVSALGLNITGDAANEPTICIDPTNPNRIAIGWRQFDNVASNFRQGGYAHSTDGGQHWTFPGVLEPGVFRSDPVLASNASGEFFYSSLRSTFCVDVYRSTDHGATWPASTPAFGGDKQWMAIDSRTSGLGAGNIYQAWQSGAQCQATGNLFTRSTDGGLTWMTPVPVNFSPRFGVLAVGPDGEVYVVGDGSSANVVVDRSTNARDPAVTPTFDVHATGDFLGGSQVLGAGPNPGGLLGQFWIAVNPTTGPNRGHVYLLCSVNPAGSDPLDVRFARSTDGGATWSASVRVNDDSTTNGAYQWFGTLSIAPNGRLDAVWNDTRGDPGNALSRLYYSFSIDEGVTWSPNVALTPAWNSLIGFPNQNKIGDYYHMISDNAGASLAYAATFNGEQDVYFMRIAAGDCNTNGTPDVVEPGYQDCDVNGTADFCELGMAGMDCNTNGTFDLCESIAAGLDCNTNGTLDACDILAGQADCNTNASLDACDLSRSGSGVAVNSTPTAIDDLATAGATVTAVQQVFVTDVNAQVNVRHTAAGQLQILLARLNTTVVLASGVGGSGDDFSNTAFDQQAAAPITAASPPFAGTFRPQGNLDAFNSLPKAGAWTLTVADTLAGETGTLLGWSLVTRQRLMADCNTDGTPDACELVGMDCDTNGSLDLCEFDCNTNGTPDPCEAAAGDANSNGTPDVCEPFPPCTTCTGDMNADSRVDGVDIPAFVGCLLAFPSVAPGCGCADVNADHQIKPPDVSLFVTKLLAGGCP